MGRSNKDDGNNMAVSKNIPRVGKNNKRGSSPQKEAAGGCVEGIDHPDWGLGDIRSRREGGDIS